MPNISINVGMNFMNSGLLLNEEQFLFKAFCAVCSCSFPIEKGGKSDINHYTLTGRHER